MIDPEGCIDCTLCVAESPVEAICAAEDVPPAQREFIALNAELARQWPVLMERKSAPPDADDWAGKPDKRALLAR